MGGIVQPTPLRLRYLAMVLTAYREQYGHAMPIDVWNIHNFILPENCGWGAGIPPGLEAYAAEGIPCPATYDDHGSLTIFAERLRAFRQWVAIQGYRDRPVIVSEYGILLSPYHGYGYPRVRNFMLGTFDWMLTATDPNTGYSLDQNHLVQEFAWFSLNYAAFNPITGEGLNGNLFERDSRQITPLGLAYEAYVKTVTEDPLDLALTQVEFRPSPVESLTPISLTATFVNGGVIPAQNVTVRFWHNAPANGGILLGTTAVASTVGAKCTPTQATLRWTPTQAGLYTINIALDPKPLNNAMTLTVSVSSMSTPLPTLDPTQTATSTEIPTLPPSPTNTPTVIANATRTPIPTEIPTLPPSPTNTPTVTPTLAATPQPIDVFAFDLSVLPTEPNPGDALIYTLNYCNNGVVAINDVVFRLVLPFYTNFNNSESDAGWVCLQPYAGNPCQFPKGRIDAKSCGLVKLALTVHRLMPDSVHAVVLTVNAANSEQTLNRFVPK